MIKFCVEHHFAGRHAEGRTTRHGMDHYASKSKNASAAPSTQQAAHVVVADTYRSPSPPRFGAPGQLGLQYLIGFADLHTDKIVLTQPKSVCPLSFLPSEFSKFLHLSR